MIFLLAHLIFAIFGIMTLSKGRVSLNKNSEITGPAARKIGIFALLTFPIAWVLGFIYGLYWALTNPVVEISAPLAVSYVVNGGAFLIVGISIFLIAKKNAQKAMDDPAEGPG